MYYLKKFENDADYLTYINGEDVLLPNVSYCASEVHVHYNPYVPPMNVITYQATEKLTETTYKPYPQSGLYTTAFSDANGQRLTMTSHTFENGVGTIEFDGDIASIGAYAFAECSDLTSITIPNSVTSIGVYAFSNTPWWNTYSADTNNHYGNIIYINNVAYQATARTITSCTFREGTVSIGGRAFAECSDLTSITIPNSVTTIGDSAFQSCKGLTSVNIPNTVTSIGEMAFRDCSSLESVAIGNSVTSIGSGAFYNCTNLTSVTIGNGVTSIGDNAFRDCSSLESVAIGNSVTSIGDYAFCNCTNLTSVNIPNSVTSIGSSAFRDCSSLASVNIPNSVTSIGSSAFRDCSSLASIASLATTAPTIQSSTFDSVKTGGTLTVPSGSTGYDVWMGTGDYYLGKYGWTKVEQ